MQYFRIVVSFFIIMTTGFMQPCEFLIEPISSNNLDQEQLIFEKFYQYYCGFLLDKSVVQELVHESFSREQVLYEQGEISTLFYHVVLDGQVIGYVSCDLLPGYQIHIRHLVFDPDMYDAVLIKELLFAVFSAVPQAKYVMLHCPFGCPELSEVFEEIGFNSVTSSTHQPIELYVEYELLVHSKCKICDVLYGQDFWEYDDSDDSWDDAYADGLTSDGFRPEVEQS